MELLIRLIEFIVRSALEQNKRNAAPPVSATPATSQPRAQVATPRSLSMGQPGAQIGSPQGPTLSSGGRTPDPLYDDRGWRTALTVLAFIVLLIIVAAWAAYIYSQRLTIN